MSTPPDSPTRSLRPELFIRAKTGTITETVGNFVTSPFRPRRQSSVSSSVPSHRLSGVVSKITLKDIQSAKRCGAGGFGVVWVLEPMPKGKIALKQLRVTGTQQSDDLLRHTLREGETWQDLSHPWVLPFLGILETPTDLYLISPYIENGAIDVYLRNHPDADRWKFIWETAGAIAYLHECGIVHGDIKASNILISDDIHVLLCDFGLARFETVATSIGLQGVGTIRFQSPELLHHGGGKTPASDAWAFGMTIYEVLSGYSPFHEYPHPRMIDAVANKGERPPKIPSHSPSGLSYTRLWNVADGCWELEPARRLSMEDAHHRLRPDWSVIRGHADWARSNPASPEDGAVVSGSSNRTIRFWGTEPSNEHSEGWEGRTDRVWSVSYSPDGKTIVSGSDDHTIRLWDVNSASQRGDPLRGHTGYVQSVAFSPDSKTVVSGSDDHTIRLWDVETGVPLGDPLEGHTGVIWSVAFSPDGKKIVSASADKTVRIWDVETASQWGRSLRGHTDEVNSVSFSPDDRIIVSAADDFTIRLWDPETGIQQGEPLTGHTEYVLSVAFSPDGKTLVSGSNDHTIRLWDVESASQRGEPLIGHTHEVKCVAFSPDGKTIVSGSFDRTIRFWDAESGAQQGDSLEGHTDLVWSVSFSPDGRTLVSGSFDRTVRLWELSDH